jgi:hypothetical protein
VAGSGSLFDRIRAACRAVAEGARCVRIDPDGLAALAHRLPEALAQPPALDPAHLPLGSDDTTLAFVLTLDSVNFGSGWFPYLRKRPGLSGYFTIATGLKQRFERKGPWSARELRSLGAPELAVVLGQEPCPPEVSELMELFARALRDLGELLEARYAGRYAALLESAGGSAECLVARLAEMPLYRDVARYAGTEVPFYKRAQLAAADLALALGGQGLGRFEDLDRLTLFADNLVPHVLRLEGALVYDAGLLRRIEAGEEIPAGSPEEVEIRAGAVHAVELLVAGIRARGGRATARELDFVLWNRGQRPEFKARPRHRTRTSFY